MKNQHHTHVNRAIFYLSVARERLSEIKEAVANEAKAPEGKAEGAEEVAAGLERAIFADAVFKALLGFELIEERLKIATKLHGALKVESVGPLSAVSIRKESGLTEKELASLIPDNAVVDPFAALAEIFGENYGLCQCPKCQAKRSGG